jgi:DNA-binding CsgD family transcriptional regulator
MFPRLTRKELDIVSCIYFKGFDTKQIAAQLGNSRQVIKNRLHGVYRKLGVHNCVGLLMYCQRHPELFFDQAPPPRKSARKELPIVVFDVAGNGKIFPAVSLSERTSFLATVVLGLSANPTNAQIRARLEEEGLI